MIFFLHSQTNIPAGNVSGTWFYDNSPYYIEGDIFIPLRHTLKIEPEAEILFSGFFELDVRGRILAIGFEINHIKNKTQNQENE